MSDAAEEQAEAACPLDALAELLRAAAGGDEQAAVKLRAVVNEADEEDGWTPLIWAAAEGDAQLVDGFLRVAGVDANKADNVGKTALMWAAGRGHADIVRTLLAAPGVEVNAADNHGSTALALACQYAHKEAADVLLANKGVDVTISDSDGDTSLMCAAHGGDSAIVTGVLSRLPPSNQLNAANKAGRTALMWAAGGGHAAAVEALLKVDGVDVAVKDKEGNTACDLAVAGGHFKDAGDLLSKLKI